MWLTVPIIVGVEVYFYPYIESSSFSLYHIVSYVVYIFLWYQHVYISYGICKCYMYILIVCIINFLYSKLYYNSLYTSLAVYKSTLILYSIRLLYLFCFERLNILINTVFTTIKVTFTKMFR